MTDRVQGVRLEPLDERWLDDVAALVADPDVLRFTRIPEPPPPEFERGWIQAYVTARREGTREGFAAIDGDGRFLGSAWRRNIDREGGEIELGYIVAREARGRGAGTAILHLLTRWAFDDMRAQRVYLIIDVENHPSLPRGRAIRLPARGGHAIDHVKQGRRADVEVWSRLPTDPVK